MLFARESEGLRLPKEVVILPLLIATQFVWFLAPTVALASQQHDVISTQLPALHSRFLSGADGVDRWSEQQIWDEILAGIRIVVSTYQV